MANNESSGEPPAGTPDPYGLDALGLAEVPLLQPLCYPGRPVTAPSLLLGRRLLPLAAEPGAAPAAWTVQDGGPPRTLDAALRAAGAAPLAARTPVLAVGSNAAPAQLAHKLAARGLSGAVPLSPVHAAGVAVGVSPHLGRAGYVPAAPYADPAGSALAVGWYDAEQLSAVDATELAYHRRPAPGPVLLPTRDPLPGCALYVHRVGVLAGDDGAPLPTGTQEALITGLLDRSRLLRTLFGDPADPAEFVRRAAADEELRAAAALLFADEGRVLPHGLAP